MKKHLVELLAETQGMKGYQFINWIKKRTESEFEGLTELFLSLASIIEVEKKSREVRL